MNWNALEWDRAAEELTWERVRLLSIKCPGVLILMYVLKLAIFRWVTDFAVIFDENNYQNFSF